MSRWEVVLLTARPSKAELDTSQNGDGKAFISGFGEKYMGDVKWFMQGKMLGYCSCDYGCPCEFMVEPSYGHCDGAMAMKVDEGYYDESGSRAPLLSPRPLRTARMSFPISRSSLSNALGRTRLDHC